MISEAIMPVYLRESVCVGEDILVTDTWDGLKVVNSEQDSWKAWAEGAIIKVLYGNWNIKFVGKLSGVWETITHLIFKIQSVASLSNIDFFFFFQVECVFLWDFFTNLGFNWCNLRRKVLLPLINCSHRISCKSFPFILLKWLGFDLSFLNVI